MSFEKKGYRIRSSVFRGHAFQYLEQGLEPYYMFEGWDHEKRSRECLCDDDVFIDVGACIGGWSIPAALICKKVFAFEPNKTFATILRKNVALNGLKNIKIIQKPVWNKVTGIVYDDWVVYESMADEEMELIRRKVKEMGKEAHLSRRRTVTLDTFCDESIIPTFIKIDVEGEELRVLNGARFLIAEYKPRMLVEAHKQYDPNIVGKVVQYVLELNHEYTLRVTALDGVQTSHLYFV